MRAYACVCVCVCVCVCDACYTSGLFNIIFNLLPMLATAMTNLCRDEVTTILKDKIEQVFGSSFNTNGLGAVLTCGVIGIRAGLSHSPVCEVRGLMHHNQSLAMAWELTTT